MLKKPLHLRDGGIGQRRIQLGGAGRADGFDGGVELGDVERALAPSHIVRIYNRLPCCY